MATIITMPKFDFQEYKYSQLEKEEEMYFWDRKVCSFFPQLNFCILTKAIIFTVILSWLFVVLYLVLYF
ncbi:hypothetical protein H8356DRAFT_1653989 [Neocallimastix lanati (nom. inval.)]|uniref:Uncharacterized protein n=1 Tax=Neocallimastix californiae TaxID=1754190 RepID=A0A1Y1ZIC8_9FUNG|nr:hypothetical protein H8356DRAFT_1653989 [Neocallimastix sp. JGI-2020a]ORY09787.1 hypothetical protein LY90DRAFT_708953 [Neocallimastix californiae]|eukprot:ORY09787.1 hypothetical protein LY90DRAFT_708953 [Neocallimastix californiae]